MEKKSKVVSKRLRKQLDELERANDMMKLPNCWNLLPAEAMLMHNTRWENCFTIKWYMKRKQ